MTARCTAQPDVRKAAAHPAQAGPRGRARLPAGSLLRAPMPLPHLPGVRAATNKRGKGSAAGGIRDRLQQVSCCARWERHAGCSIGHTGLGTAGLWEHGAAPPRMLPACAKIAPQRVLSSAGAALPCVPAQSSCITCPVCPPPPCAVCTLTTACECAWPRCWPPQQVKAGLAFPLGAPCCSPAVTWQAGVPNKVPVAPQPLPAVCAVQSSVLTWRT